MKSFEQVAEEHCQWAKEVFPQATSIGAMIHLQKEAKEVIADIELEMPIEWKAVEYADCLGCLLSSMSREGVTVEMLLSAFDKKLQVNKNRKWRYNGDGSYSHIKEETGTETNSHFGDVVQYRIDADKL